MIIPANKKRIPIVFIVGLMLSILLIFLIVDAVKHIDEGFENSIYLGAYIGLSIGVIKWTIVSFLDYLKTTFDKKAILTITEAGINDNLNLFSIGAISWADIIDIKIKKVFKTNFLVIEVKDPQLFINRKSKLEQRTLKSFLKKFGSPIVISQKRIKYNVTDLKDIINKARVPYFTQP